MVMGVLSSALDLAKAAVAHDEQGALPEKVLPYYKKVCENNGRKVGGGQGDVQGMRGSVRAVHRCCFCCSAAGRWFLERVGIVVSCTKFDTLAI